MDCNTLNAFICHKSVRNKGIVAVPRLQCEQQEIKNIYTLD